MKAKVAKGDLGNPVVVAGQAPDVGALEAGSEDLNEVPVEPPKKVAKGDLGNAVVVAARAQAAGAREAGGEDLNEVWAAHWGAVTLALGQDQELLAAVTSFAEFTKRSLSVQREHGVQFLITPVGLIGVSEASVLTWLSWRRNRMALPSSKGMPISVKTLRELFSGLRSGLHELEIPDLPAWAKAHERIPAAFTRRLALWKRDEARHPLKKVFRKAVLPAQQVEAYCMHIAGLLVDGEVVTDKQLAGAVLLRFQSGSNVRSANLVQDIHWRSVRPLGGLDEAFAVVFINTKRATGNASAKQLAELVLTAVRDVDDLLSQYLTRAWFFRHHKKVDMEDAFFPTFLPCGAADFRKPMSNKVHNAVVRECASHGGLVTNAVALAGYTSTSIRRGNAEGLIGIASLAVECEVGTIDFLVRLLVNLKIWNRVVLLLFFNKEAFQCP